MVLGGGHTFSPFLNLNHYNWDAHLIQEIAYGTNTNQQGWRVYVWSNTAPDPLFDVRAQSYAMCAQVAP